MLPIEHTLAQTTADEADQAFASGDMELAEQLYARAAQSEQTAFDQIPREKVRTIGIVGVSLATLWYRASNYERADEVAQRLLDEFDLLPAARRNLEEVVSAIPKSMSMAVGDGRLSPLGRSRASLGKATVARLRSELHLVRAEATTAAAASDNLEKLYSENHQLLLFVATRKFRVPDEEAENLVNEVFVSYMSEEERIEPSRARSWLVAGICNASRHYWRSVNRTARIAEDLGAAERLDAALPVTISSVLQHLNERTRKTLFMHYVEGRTVREIAQELGTTGSYAEKLVHNSLKRARETYRELEKNK